MYFLDLKTHREKMQRTTVKRAGAKAEKNAQFVATNTSFPLPMQCEGKCVQTIHSAEVFV